MISYDLPNSEISRKFLEIYYPNNVILTWFLLFISIFEVFFTSVLWLLQVGWNIIPNSLLVSIRIIVL